MNSLWRNLRIALPPFLKYLEPGLIVFSLPWLLVAGTTVLVSYVSHPSGNYVQRWWLLGSVHLAALMAAVTTRWGRELVRSGTGILVPGWRQGNLAIVVSGCGLLVLIPFFAGGVWAWMANENWDFSSLAWFCVAINVGVLVASLIPSCGSIWLEASMLLMWIFFVESYVLLSMGAKGVRPLLLTAANYPWAMAAGSLLIAGAAFRYATRPRPQIAASRLRITQRLPIWQSATWLTGRVGPLLGGFFRGPVANPFNVVIGAWFVSSKGGQPVLEAVLLYLTWYSIVTGGFTADLKLARTASMLMWLPTGLARSSLGFDVFRLLLKRTLVFGVAYTVLIAAIEFPIHGTVRFQAHPEQLVLLVGYAIFVAGWAVASYRPSHGKLKQALMVMTPTLMASAVGVGCLILFSRRYEPSASSQLVIAVTLAASGWILGRHFSKHWGRQEISALLKPAKLTL